MTKPNILFIMDDQHRIVAGPNIAAGSESHALVELANLNPTICDLAGVPSLENIDTQSFQPLLTDKTNEHRDVVVCSMHNFRAIRTHTHKFIANYNDQDELYDLVMDPDEMVNMVDE